MTKAWSISLQADLLDCPWADAHERSQDILYPFWDVVPNPGTKYQTGGYLCQPDSAVDVI